MPIQALCTLYAAPTQLDPLCLKLRNINVKSMSAITTLALQTPPYGNMTSLDPIENFLSHVFHFRDEDG